MSAAASSDDRIGVPRYDDICRRWAPDIACRLMTRKLSEFP